MTEQSVDQPRYPYAEGGPSPASGGAMMTPPAEIDDGAGGYRTKARALRRQAKGISDSGARTGMLFTALYYEALANQLERAEETPPADECARPQVEPELPAE